MSNAWRKVVDAAPSLLQRCRAVWDGVSARRPRAVAQRLAEANAQIDVRVQALEQRAAGLEEEAAASFDVVRSIAEQHSQLAEQNAGLVEEVDALASRVKLLGWACAGLAIAAAILLVLVFTLR
jgi:hypothetical protein